VITPEQLRQHADWLIDGSGQRIEASSANLRYADLCYANLRYADLRGANLRGANLRYADLSSADLRGADLSSADLRYADLSSADLRGADLSGADLRYADLRYADLRGADLGGADLSGAIGNMREIKSAQFDQWTVAWSSDVLAIDCQQHAITKWRNADPRWIAAMDSSATDWWSRYGELILQLIDVSPATGVVLEVAA
jgi:uncharacterized protein YjbI with pentapeptide repeats